MGASEPGDSKVYLPVSSGFARVHHVGPSCLYLRLPLRFIYGRGGKRIFTPGASRIKGFLDFVDVCVARLAQAFCPPDQY